MKRTFVAKNHLCWFSKTSEYQKMTVNEVFKVNPDYILWCYKTLKHLRFATGISNKLKKLKP